ncbi:ornithine cyclodeaminase family protein [Pseudomonas sp. Q1-7]|uniref:ornithine cyclodeaminase family protein n=1 Tax=Pseudomonas sp. Q1-7 TaxID=3020843 RepID=UPI00230057DA|nr:ornithine cyclodeaminase family protein [Pseudomonas sp. Q1-7]
MSSTPPLVLQQTEARRLLQQVDVHQAMRRMFLDLAAGDALQPSQQLVEFPNAAGDFINYLGVLAKEGVYGVKTSPYIKTADGAIVTAWTLLMSMETGQPLLLCDAGELTTARTAATTAVAVECLAPDQARTLAVIGSGPVARAHLDYVKGLRDWQRIAVFSPSLADDEGLRTRLLAQDARVEISASLEEAVADAEVVMLCTSSAEPLLDPRQLSRPALVTSISTNAPRAHEVSPDALPGMDVYCDYRATTPASAGEMLLATARQGWGPASIRGDLAELVSGQAPRPDYSRPVFFRSIGLGLEDVALANALYHLQRQGQ